MTGVALVRVTARQRPRPRARANEHSHSTVSTVSPPPGLWCLLNNDVFDDELVNGEVFGIGVRLGILQKGKDEFDGFLGPST